MEDRVLGGENQSNYYWDGFPLFVFLFGDGREVDILPQGLAIIIGVMQGRLLEHPYKFHRFPGQKGRKEFDQT